MLSQVLVSRFTFSEIQNWAIRLNGVEGKVVSRGYWCVNLTASRTGLLPRFATKHADGTYTIRPEVIAALRSVGV